MKRLIFSFCFVLSGFISLSQDIESLISLDIKDLPLDIVLDRIAERSNFNFSYNAEILPSGSLFTLKRDSISVDKLLEILLIGTGLTYALISDQIIIRQSKNELLRATSNTGKLSKAQVAGWVRTYKTKEPLIGANVFINGTTIGTTTDDYGNYRLPSLQEGSHLLIFSYLGYEIVSYPLKVLDGQAFRINGLMNEKITQLRNVEIQSKPLVEEYQHSKYLRLFSREFIGRSANASRCSIENPNALDFGKDEEDMLLWAESDRPIIVNNLALGYRVSFDLEYFRLDSGVTKFYAKARFENLSPENKRTRKRWKRNRQKTYEGSAFHFFKSLMLDRLEVEGFELLYLAEDGRDSIGVKSQDIVTKDSHGVWWFDPKKPLAVTYTKELESLQYLKIAHEPEEDPMFFFRRNQLMHEEKPKFQRSVLEIIGADKVLIDLTGKILEPKKLIVRGYWSWERMADLIPLDYNPKTDNL